MKKNLSKGFSLFELMITLGIGAIATLYVGSMVVESMKSSKISDEEVEISELLGNLHLKLSMKGLCDANLKGLDADNSSLTSIKDTNNRVLFELGDQKGASNSIVIDKFITEKKSDKKVNLIIHLQRKGQSTQKEIKRVIGLNVELDAADKIQGCKVDVGDNLAGQVDLSCNGDSTIMYKGDESTPDDDKCYHAGYSSELCPTNQMVVGFEQFDLGTAETPMPIFRPVCKDIVFTEQRCPSGQVLVGLDTDKKVICRDSTIADVASVFDGATSNCAAGTSAVIVNSGGKINISCTGGSAYTLAWQSSPSSTSTNGDLGASFSTILGGSIISGQSVSLALYSNNTCSTASAYSLTGTTTATTNASGIATFSSVDIPSTAPAGIYYLQGTAAVAGSPKTTCFAHTIGTSSLAWDPAPTSALNLGETFTAPAKLIYSGSAYSGATVTLNVYSDNLCTNAILTPPPTFTTNGSGIASIYDIPSTSGTYFYKATTTAPAALATTCHQVDVAAPSSQTCPTTAWTPHSSLSWSDRRFDSVVCTSGSAPSSASYTTTITLQSCRSNKYGLPNGWSCLSFDKSMGYQFQVSAGEVASLSGGDTTPSTSCSMPNFLNIDGNFDAPVSPGSSAPVGTKEPADNTAFGMNIDWSIYTDSAASSVLYSYGPETAPGYEFDSSNNLSVNPAVTVVLSVTYQLEGNNVSPCNGVNPSKWNAVVSLTVNHAGGVMTHTYTPNDFGFTDGNYPNYVNLNFRGEILDSVLVSPMSGY